MADGVKANVREARARVDAMRKSAFIGGHFVEARSQERFDIVSSADSLVVGSAPACDVADVDAAVAAARAAFDGGAWSRADPATRRAGLLRFADAVEQCGEELALLDALDMGKSISSAREVDVAASVACLRWCAEYIDKAYDRVAPTGEGALATITHEPLGVVAAVIPWNFPLMMAAWKLGPALAMGNSMILKPAEQSPLSAMRLAELWAQAGLPEGVFNVVTGFGETAGKALGLHGDVDAVAFTGSTAVGKLFLQYAGASNMKRISLECGGKSAAVIMPDADLDLAVETVGWGAFFNQGECCDALSRLLVHRSIREEVVERLAAMAGQVRVGHPMDTQTQMGAILDRTQYERIEGYLRQGEAEGATIAHGGKRVLADLGGYYMEPTVFTGARNEMAIAQEEIFGPVATVIDFETEDEAVRVANDTIYGLVAALFTKDLNTAHKVSRRLRAGAVWVNCFDAGDMTVPHGGYKQSGIGRDRSIVCFDKYCETKTTWIALS
jgi:acyl-CoA reductase-like NAD-dependent aldehyde dehydrogenase